MPSFGPANEVTGSSTMAAKSKQISFFFICDPPFMFDVLC
jgi:hypothetical protein